MFRRWIPLSLGLLLPVVARAVDLPTPTDFTWHSAAMDADLKGQIYTPADAAEKPLPLVVYQKNLSVARLGQEADEPILDDFLKAGDEVLVLDYAKNEKAKSPTISADYLAFRQDLSGKAPKLTLPGAKVNQNQIYFVIEGYRLAHEDFGKTPKRTLGMDIFYPSQPSHPVPLLMEFTCDNQDRMGSSSLLFCHDTLVEGGESAGFATAMVDHPVDPPYKGLDDPMPEVFNRAKAAVFAARMFVQNTNIPADSHGVPIPAKYPTFNRRIGVIGFSRGGPIAAMMAVSNTFPPADCGQMLLKTTTGVRDDASPSSMPAGVSGNISIQPDVEAALIHGNRYDYLDLLPKDKDIAKFKKAWGDPTTQPAKWGAHSAVFYIKDPKTIAPMFLNTSNAEQVEYQDGLAKFEKKLTDLGVEHVYQVDNDDRGHKVSTDPKTLTAIYAFFHKHLD